MFNFEERTSDPSPYIEKIWRNRPESGGPFISMAIDYCQIVISKLPGKMYITVRGPETKATLAYCPPGAEHYGVILKLGTVMPSLPAGQLRDSSVTLPEAGSRSFWLNGSVWQYPDYENMETFITRLERAGLLVSEPIVDAVIKGQRVEQSIRSVQRRFLRATGLTNGALRQIERARYATSLLQQGRPILDVVDEAGYADQPHLTRSLKHFIGQTPAQFQPSNSQPQLSFLFKTALFA